MANPVLDLRPVVVDLELVQGTDNPIEFQLRDGAGNPISIVGDTIKFTARDGYNGQVKITLSNNPAQHSDPSIGKTIFLLSKTLTATLDLASETAWLYEVRRIAADGLETVYFTGSVLLEPTVGAA